MLDAVKKPAPLDAATIKQRNDSINKQLYDKKLHSTDVVGDGNCLFRAISQCVYGSQSKHNELRIINIVHHLLNKFDIIFDTGSLSPADFSTLQTHAQSLLMNGQWAGEECIMAAADFLKTDIHLYVFVANISPIVYSPATDSARHQPIALVFYEPGHYCSVSSLSGRVSLDALSTSLSSAISSEPTGEQSSSASSSVSLRNAPLDAPLPSSPSNT